VDGNVLRVVSRILDSHADITKPDTKAEITRTLQEVFAMVPAANARPDLFNQSLMELGATVCVPNGAPQCLCCPVTEHCLGYQRGTAPSLPVKEPKKPRRIEEKTVLLLRFEGNTAIRKRPDRGILAGLWELPNLDGTLSPEEALAAFGISSDAIAKALPLAGAKHIFTHIEWIMTGWEITLTDTADCPTDWLWLPSKTILSEYPLPSAFKAYRKLV
jgi:A/G-specific adenine glycosylase